MSGIRGVASVVVCSLILAVAAPAAAAADPAQGRAAFDEGRRLFHASDHRKALASFKKGFLSMADTSFLLNIAQCHRFLGEPKEALNFCSVGAVEIVTGAPPYVYGRWSPSAKGRRRAESPDPSGMKRGSPSPASLREATSPRSRGEVVSGQKTSVSLAPLVGPGATGRLAHGAF
jgi:hypothetical protein